MKFSPLLAAFTALVPSVYAQTFVVNTPGIIPQCKRHSMRGYTRDLVWRFWLNDVTDGGAVVQQISNIAGTSLELTVNVPGGHSAAIEMFDSNGELAQTAPFSVLASCGVKEAPRQPIVLARGSLSLFHVRDEQEHYGIRTTVSFWSVTVYDVLDECCRSVGLCTDCDLS
ncbi:hypothetical protein C8Q74DRAFT_1219540 [Fomes fomentarius]|nr:hypothetical protein C8Q74DRAFT_1219540 [Fomes fomentarius]